MTSPTQVLKSVGPKLVPFFKTVAIYFVLCMRLEQHSIFQVIIKCLPIISLIVFILLHGMSLGNEYAYSRRIIFGLMWSCLGDAFLVYPQYFLHGMAAFSIAQVVYTGTFGFKPLNIPLGAICYAISLLANVILVHHLAFPLVVCVPIYSILLTTMAWRATARVQFFAEFWTWTKLCSCLGGISFLVSDTILAFNAFYAPIPHADFLIMLFYYGAQLGIALSVVDSKDCYHAEQLQLKKLATKQCAELRPEKLE